MYKLITSENIECSIRRLIDSVSIPFDPANTDYQTFRKDVAGGVELQDADGNLMTQEEAEAFIASLPE